MGYTTPGKFSLGVDTSAASLKKDVKKNLAKKGGLGVDTSIKHDTSKSASAVKKAINAPTTKQTPGGNVPMGSAEDIAELKALNPTSKAGGPSWPRGDDSDLSNTGPLMPPNTSGSEGKRLITKAENDKVLNDVGSRVSSGDLGNWATDRFATNTRQNNDMQNTKNSMDGSKQKSVSRGAYIPSKHGLASSITRSETSGNVNTPGGGTGFIPKGKGSSVTSYEIPMENQTSSKIDFDSTTDAGIEDRYGKAASENLTGKAKRQANRKTRQTDRQEKRGKKSDSRYDKKHGTNLSGLR